MAYNFLSSLLQAVIMTLEALIGKTTTFSELKLTNINKGKIVNPQKHYSHTLLQHFLGKRNMIRNPYFISTKGFAVF